MDGLVDAGVIRSDRRGRIVWEPVREAHGDPGVELVIESAPPYCEKCGSEEDDVQPLILGVAFCLRCYAALINTFITNQQAHQEIRGFLKEWLSKRPD